MSDGRELPTKNTSPTFDEFVTATTTAMLRVWGVYTPSALAMFWAKFQHETGAGKNCWCWNTGNVKKFAGDGHDWCFLNGVWECYPDAEAARLLASGEAKPNDKTWRTCSPGRTVVVFSPPHPQCRFRAFESLERAMYEHMLLVLNRFETAWPAALDGDVAAFVRALKSRNYFTGDEAQYARGMRGPFATALSMLSPQPPEAA